MATTKAILPDTRVQPAAWLDVSVFALLIWGMALLCTFAIRGTVDFAALDQSPSWVWGVLVLTGWLPGLAALGAQLIRTGRARGFVSGWRRPAIRWVLIALAVPSGYTTAVTVLAWLSGAAAPNLAGFTKAATDALGSGWARPEVVALCYGALTLVGGTLALSVFSLGEEIGWNGFVIPRLLPILGVPRTALVTGLLWSSYHFPLILFAKNYTQGTAIWFTLLGLTVSLTGVAFITTWLRVRSGSIWPAVLLHAIHNVWFFYVYEPLTSSKPLTPYVGGEHGVGMMLVAAVIALLVIRNQAPTTSKQR